MAVDASPSIDDRLSREAALAAQRAAHEDGRGRQLLAVGRRERAARREHGRDADLRLAARRRLPEERVDAGRFLLHLEEAGAVLVARAADGADEREQQGREDEAARAPHFFSGAGLDHDLRLREEAGVEGVERLRPAVGGEVALDGGRARPRARGRAAASLLEDEDGVDAEAGRDGRRPVPGASFTTRVGEFAPEDARDLALRGERHVGREEQAVARGLRAGALLLERGREAPRLGLGVRGAAALLRRQADLPERDALLGAVEVGVRGEPGGEVGVRRRARSRCDPRRGSRPSASGDGG